MNEQYKNAELGNLMFGNSRGNHEIDRSIYGPLWHEVFSKLNFSRGGYDGELYKNNVNYDEGIEKFENDVFIMRPYYWGDDEKLSELPNFVHKKSGLTINWYKYPLRDSYSNIELTAESFNEILEDCRNSMSDEVYIEPYVPTEEEVKKYCDRIEKNSFYGIMAEHHSGGFIENKKNR